GAVIVVPPNRFESEVESFLEGSHGDRTHIKRADHHTVTPLCGTLLFSRTGHSHVATLKPMTPLQPLTRASMNPPSPLLTPDQQPLKPTTPQQPKNAPKTPISRPQRRRRFQLAHLTGPQRRRWFQLRLGLREQRRQGFHPPRGHE
ncbi:MAG: hypothetical protein KHZ98_04270, partial [Actinomyces sp.]|nr:hypothetical protein [Actinomyces sp.]